MKFCRWIFANWCQSKVRKSRGRVYCEGIQTQVNLQKIPLFTCVLELSCDLLFLQSNQALRHGELLSREQVQFLTLGSQGDLADPDRKDLIQKVNTLLKVNISSRCCCCCFCFAFVSLAA